MNISHASKRPQGAKSRTPEKIMKNLKKSKISYFWPKIPYIGLYGQNRLFGQNLKMAHISVGKSPGALQHLKLLRFEFYVFLEQNEKSKILASGSAEAKSWFWVKNFEISEKLYFFIKSAKTLKNVF